MKCLIPVLIAGSALLQSTAMAAFQSCNDPNYAYNEVILCDDFDTYCNGGSYPIGGTHCVGADAAKHEPSLRRVWSRTSRNELNNIECGSEFTNADDGDQFDAPGEVTLWYNPGGTAPMAAWYPMQDAPRGQMSFRDWELSPLPPDTPGQVYNFSRLIQNVHGYQYDSVIGTDDDPLEFEFFIGGGVVGAIDTSGGYLELAMDEPDTPEWTRRSNTDYAWSMDCLSCTPDPIAQGPFPVMCAQGNPMSSLPAGCPPVASAIVRKAIAVGTFEMLDTEPCHCDPGAAHGPRNSHLSVFDGKQWWILRHDDPRLPPVTGEARGFKTNQVVAPEDLPEDVQPGGSFDLAGGENYTKFRAYNWIKVSIASTSFTVELKALQKSVLGNDYQYYVTSRITLPRYYEGPFNTARWGIGGGCELNSNAQWDACKPNDSGITRVRRCLDPNTDAKHLVFDSFVLHGGTGYAASGACCEGATCSLKTLEECQAAGGGFRGPSTTCREGACTGACCLGPTCTDVAQPADCPGTYKGRGTVCETTACPCTGGGYLWADADLDGDVDIDDFGKFQACFTGGAAPAPGCECMNHVPGNGIDLSDFDAFIACATGATVQVDPLNPPPGCTP